MRPILSPYEALACKARALYGKRLRYEDFVQLGHCTSELELHSTLRQHPGWAEALSSLEYTPGQYIGRVELENALADQLTKEYRSLWHFVPQKDRDLMHFPILLSERDAILQALRRLKSSAPHSTLPHVHYLEGGSVDMQALETCQNYDGVMHAAKKSIYGPALLQLRPENGNALPDYVTVENLLYTTYFTHIYRILSRQYAGETKKLLLKAFGRQADLLSIIYILRLKTYFPEIENFDYLVFPFHDRLTPEFIQALYASQDAAAAFALVRSSPYADSFQNVDVTELEDYYRRAFWSFNHQQLLTGAPSIYTAISYLNLKDLEMHALVNVIESVKYNIPYDSSFAQLIGT